jgi:hypothetical protein
MPKRSSKTPRDPNQLAAHLVALTTGDEPPLSAVEKVMSNDELRKQIMREMGRAGGLKGGKARAASMTPDRRKEIAQAAAAKRWKKT